MKKEYSARAAATALALALASSLAGCGSDAEQTSGNSAMDVEFTKGEDGNLAIDIGDGVIGSDKDGNATFVGADGVRISVDDNGNATMTGPDGKPIGPGASAEPAAEPLPLGLTLPPMSEETSRVARALPAAPGSVEVVAASLTALEPTVAHFRRLAKAKGLAIVADDNGKDLRTIEAGTDARGFTLTVSRQMMNASEIKLIVRS